MPAESIPSVTRRYADSIISPRSIDELRPLKVIVVGAGISGILAGIRFPQYVKDLDLVIYEKNEEIGGTWFENQYPGIACDIPAHTYQLSFESNPSWSNFYASGGEILKYWKRVVEKYNLREHIQLSTRVVEARWGEVEGKWRLKLQRVKTGEEFEDSADVVYRGIGTLNEWKWPNIQGLHSFEGKLVHSATWDATYDYEGQNVAVIGNGSSGIQIVPTIQPRVKRLDHYVRGRTWISHTFVDEEVKARGGESNFKYTDEEKAEWAKNPEAYLEYRKQVEHELQGIHSVTHKGSDLATGAKGTFRELMEKRLKKKSHIGGFLIPEFSPGCRRLTPGPGYLEALTEDNVEVIPTSIECVNKTGIRTSDGQQRDVDLIVCATGFDTTNRNRFPVYGQSGLKLSDRWKDYPETYMAMAVDGFPNMFMSLGPNSAVGSGNLLILIEGFAEYTAKALAKIQRENIRSMQPSQQSVKNFSNFCDAYFANTVFAEECASWYKAGKSKGRVSALWPGSSLQAMKAMEHPRWEDWEYTSVDGNPWSWFGDGWSVMDRDLSLDRTYYLGYDPKMVHEDLESTVNGGKKRTLNAIEGELLSELANGRTKGQDEKSSSIKRKAEEELVDGRLRSDVS